MNGIMHGAFNGYPENCPAADSANTTHWCIQLDIKSLIKVRTPFATLPQV